MNPDSKELSQTYKNICSISEDRFYVKHNFSKAIRKNIIETSGVNRQKLTLTEGEAHQNKYMRLSPFLKIQLTQGGWSKNKNSLNDTIELFNKL